MWMIGHIYVHLYKSRLPTFLTTQLTNMNIYIYISLSLFILKSLVVYLMITNIYSIYIYIYILRFPKMVEVSFFHKISHPAIKGYLNFRKPPARCGPAWERKSPSTGADEPQKKTYKKRWGRISGKDWKSKEIQIFTWENMG